MAAALSSLSPADPAALSDVVSAQARDGAPDVSPPQPAGQGAWCPGAHAGHTTQDAACDDRESDSGDSLFITQKNPEPRRAGPRHRHGPGSEEEEEGGSSLSALHRRSGTGRKRRTRKKRRLPKFTFPFLLGQRFRGTRLHRQQNIDVHYHAMAGFFKCVRKMWDSRVVPPLPTIDTVGEYISPLSEDEEEKSEVEDIKIVGRTCFFQLQQKRRRKGGHVQRETPADRQKRTRPPEAPTPEATHTESSNNGGPPSQSQEEMERKDEHTINDGHSVAQTETLRGNGTVIFQQKAVEEEPCRNSDAPACELQVRPRPSTQKDGNTSGTAAQPHTDDSHTDEPGGPDLSHGVPGLLSDGDNGSVCSETVLKKKRKHKADYGNVEGEKGQSEEEPEGLLAAASANMEVDETPSLPEDNRREHPALQTCDVLEWNENNWTESLAQDDATLRQEERDIPLPKQRRKVRKKDKSAAENLQQEVDGNVKSDIRAKETVFSGSCDVVTDETEKKKKKKKKRKRSDEDAEQSQSRAEMTEQQAEDEAWNRTSDLPSVSTRQIVELGSCSENTAASQEALQPGPVKRKKHKESSCQDATEDGGEGAHFKDTVIFTNCTEVSLKKKKKKKKALSERLDISYTLEENEKFENTDEQKTKKLSEDQNGTAVTVKKKKKKKKEELREKSGRNTSKVNLEQSDDSVSVRETKKKKASSFLVADAGENDVQAQGEQNLPPQHVDSHVWTHQTCSVKKKKRKRRMSAVQDGVENGHKQDLEEPRKTWESASPESASTGVKRRKKCVGNETKSVMPLERPEGAANEGCSPTNEAATLKKRKKKKKKKHKDEPCHVTQKSPQSKKSKVLNSPKAKHGYDAEISHSSSTCGHVTKETLNAVEHIPPSSETPANQALNESKKKERKKHLAVPSIPVSSPMLSDTSLCRKKKHKTGKRRLHNPSEDFLTEC